MNIFERGEEIYRNLIDYVKNYSGIDNDTKNMIIDKLDKYKFYLKYTEEDEVKGLIDEFFKDNNKKYALRQFGRRLKGEDNTIGENSCIFNKGDAREREEREADEADWSR